MIKYIVLFLLLCLPVQAASMDEAVKAATQAALAQSGAVVYAKKLGKWAMSSLAVEKETKALLLIYQVAKSRSVTLPIDRSKQLHVNENSLALSLKF